MPVWVGEEVQAMLWETMRIDVCRVLEKIYREEQSRREPKYDPTVSIKFRKRERAYGLFWSVNNTRGWPVVKRYSVPDGILGKISWEDELAEPQSWPDINSYQAWGSSQRSEEAR